MEKTRMNDRILKWKKWKKNEWMRGWLKERDRKTQMNKRCLKERNEKNESMRGWLKGKWKNEWMRGFFFKRKKWKSPINEIMFEKKELKNTNEWDV